MNQLALIDKVIIDKKDPIYITRTETVKDVMNEIYDNHGTCPHHISLGGQNARAYMVKELLRLWLESECTNCHIEIPCADLDQECEQLIVEGITQFNEKTARICKEYKLSKTMFRHLMKRYENDYDRELMGQSQLMRDLAQLLVSCKSRTAMNKVSFCERFCQNMM